MEVWEQVSFPQALLQLMGWPEEGACSVRAEVAMSPLSTWNLMFLNALG